VLCLSGALVPHYRGLLLGTCLRACKDADPLIRASAVSNLGQVCQHLHFSLGSVMHEVLSRLFTCGSTGGKFLARYESSKNSQGVTPKERAK